MVCPRCITSVEDILKKQSIAFSKVTLGEVELKKALSARQKSNLQKELKAIGFELIETRLSAIVEKIKISVSEYLNHADEKKLKLSVFITKKMPYDYSYLSDLFSSVEGYTIEHFFIEKRIEKVKELLVYKQLSLSEIAFQLGFSSVHHLSSQFKKETGLTPTHFKNIGKLKHQPAKG